MNWLLEETLNYLLICLLAIINLEIRIRWPMENWRHLDKDTISFMRFVTYIVAPIPCYVAFLIYQYNEFTFLD